MKNVLITIFFIVWSIGLFFGYRHIIKKLAAAPHSQQSETRRLYDTVKERTREIRRRADDSLQRQREFIESRRRSSSSVDPKEIQRRYRERMNDLKSRLPDRR